MKPLLLAATALLFTAAAPATSVLAPRSRIFLLKCQATVPVPAAGTKMLELWLPVPHTDKNQDVQQLKIEASAPYTVATDQYGNQMLHLKPATVPTAPLTVTLTAQITRREHLNLRATDDHAPAETEARRVVPSLVAVVSRCPVS
jgi:hypothetical protein